jgi:hypothetical protein
MLTVLIHRLIIHNKYQILTRATRVLISLKLDFRGHFLLCLLISTRLNKCHSGAGTAYRFFGAHELTHFFWVKFPVAQSLVFCVVLCIYRSLFVFYICFPLPLNCLSFTIELSVLCHWIVCPSPLNCLSFDLRILVTFFVSLIFLVKNSEHFDVTFRDLLVRISFSYMRCVPSLNQIFCIYTGCLFFYETELNLLVCLLVLSGELVV